MTNTIEVIEVIEVIDHIWWGYTNLVIPILLVGGWATPLKNMTSSIGMIRNTQY